jgi:hypothetical protein
VRAAIRRSFSTSVMLLPKGVLYSLPGKRFHGSHNDALPYYPVSELNYAPLSGSECISSVTYVRRLAPIAAPQMIR